MPDIQLTAEFISSIHQVDEHKWDKIIGNYPFLQHALLAAFEDSNSTTKETGWQVNHLLVWCANAEPAQSHSFPAEKQLIAVMPCYLKHHSYGEYVFDWSWADAYRRAGMSYYPKLLSAIPFTPCTGPRLCISNPVCELFCEHSEQNAAAQQIQQHVVDFVLQTFENVCEQKQLSSAHILFPEENALYSTHNNWQQRTGVQFHWHNRGYKHFDDFLAEMSSRKRKNLKKERQHVLNDGIEILQFTDDQLSNELWAMFYHCYQITYSKRSGHGGYINRDFFETLGKNMPNKVLLVTAWREANPEIGLHQQLLELCSIIPGAPANKVLIASSLFLIGEDTLYGRYWGAFEDSPGLHFECCYYQGIEFAIAHGLKKIDAGAQGEHKIQRGFEPIMTHSWHYVRDERFRDAVEDFLQHEKRETKMYLQQTRELLPFKNRSREN